MNIVVGNGVWLSLVERYVRDVEAAGSNPVTPMILIYYSMRALAKRSLFYAQARIRKFAADAACGPRGE